MDVKRKVVGVEQIEGPFGAIRVWVEGDTCYVECAEQGFNFAFTEWLGRSDYITFVRGKILSEVCPGPETHQAHLRYLARHLRHLCDVLEHQIAGGGGGAAVVDVGGLPEGVARPVDAAVCGGEGAVIDSGGESDHGLE